MINTRNPETVSSQIKFTFENFTNSLFTWRLKLRLQALQWNLLQGKYYYKVNSTYKIQIKLQGKYSWNVNSVIRKPCNYVNPIKIATWNMKSPVPHRHLSKPCTSQASLRALYLTGISQSPVPHRHLSKHCTWQA